jgi:hypothetical protein
LQGDHNYERDHYDYIGKDDDGVVHIASWMFIKCPDYYTKL